MTPTTIMSVLLGLALLLFISLRQMQWQSVRIGKMLRMPVVLFAVGLFVAAQTFKNPSILHPHGAEIALIGLEVVLAVLGGLVMGRVTEIATRAGVTSSRLRPAGLGVWFGFLAVRIGLDLFAHTLHFELAASTPLILCMVAIVKATQALVVRDRVERHEAQQTAGADSYQLV